MSFIHEATGNEVFSHEMASSRNHLLQFVAPLLLHDSVLSEPTFPSIFVGSPPPVGREVRKARKPVINNLMTSSASEDEDNSETDDEGNEKNKKPPPMSQPKI